MEHTKRLRRGRTQGTSRSEPEMICGNSNNSDIASPWAMRSGQKLTPTPAASLCTGADIIGATLRCVRRCAACAQGCAQCCAQAASLHERARANWAEGARNKVRMRPRRPTEGVLSN